jgi:hypothetical protein
MKTLKGGNLSVGEFVKAFGDVPNDADLQRITQNFIKSYHRNGVDPFELVSGFGIDWVELLMKYNEEIEEYELCSIFRDLINDYKNK